MVEFELPTPFSKEFLAKIPHQRAVINDFLEEGKIQSYALSMDRDKLWCVVNADTETDVYEIIGLFPLIDFMKAKITELMFNNSVIMQIPTFSLN